MFEPELKKKSTFDDLLRAAMGNNFKVRLEATCGDALNTYGSSMRFECKIYLHRRHCKHCKQTAVSQYWITTWCPSYGRHHIVNDYVEVAAASGDAEAKAVAEAIKIFKSRGLK